jgi:hypothetical protein
MTFGLYNSYDRVKFREAHRRALARVAPLALAYDANLATFGFPFPAELRKPVDIARWVAGTTTIGEGGKYFIDLAEAGRFDVFSYPDPGFPPQYGAVVVTTAKPDGEKSVTPEVVATMLAAGKSILLVFGLGPRGLEKTQVGKRATYHLDVTGRGFALETATALGAVAAAIANRQPPG